MVQAARARKQLAAMQDHHNAGGMGNPAMMMAPRPLLADMGYGGAQQQQQQQQQQRAYDPAAGFAVFFDFVLGVPTQFRRLQVAYAFYDGGRPLTRLRALDAPGVDCEVRTRGLEDSLACSR